MHIRVFLRGKGNKLTEEKLSFETIPNCWEYNHCPEEMCRTCPAYPHMGKECWKVTGTNCAEGSLRKATFSEKILYCRNSCDFYKRWLKNLFP